MSTILIFAGGEHPGAELADELPAADLAIAADGGYDLARSLEQPIAVLVGDMDSIVATDIPETVVVERHSPDKDQTDLELAFELAIREDPARIVVVGGDGGRLDHELAAAGLMCSRRWEGAGEIDWVSSRGWAHVVHHHRIIHADIGALVSLVPMGGPAGGVTTKGLRWELKDQVLEVGTTLGVSNVMTSPVAEITVTSGCLLVVIPAT
jgi:thiamine pyrophosphokinase